MKKNFTDGLFNKQGVNFTLKVILFILIFFVLDHFAGNTLKYFYSKQNHGWTYRITYAIDSANADVIFIGASTANHHYDPRIFEKRLGMSAYNAGFDCSNIIHHYAVLTSILRRCSPKMIVLDFYPGGLKKEQSTYDKLSNLLPYYQSHPYLQPIINLRSPFEKYKLISKIYPYNSMMYGLYIKELLLNQSPSDDKEAIHGFLPEYRVGMEPLETDTSTTPYQLDSNEVRFLKSFIRECQDHEVQLYIVFSPRYVKSSGKEQSLDYVRNLARKSDVKVFDFTTDTLFWNHRDYFVDRIHLNAKGATIFSNDVTDSILQTESRNRDFFKTDLSTK